MMKLKTEDKKIVSMLSREDAGDVLMALLCHREDPLGEMPILSPVANIVYTAIATRNDFEDAVGLEG